MTNVPFLLIRVIPLIILHSSFLNSHKIRNSKLFLLFVTAILLRNLLSFRWKRPNLNLKKSTDSILKMWHTGLTRKPTTNNTKGGLKECFPFLSFTSRFPFSIFLFLLHIIFYLSSLCVVLFSRCSCNYLASSILQTVSG